jgi:hypothetical protein
VTVEQRCIFADTARRLGDDVELTRLPAIGHVDLIAPSSGSWPAVERTVVKVLGPH